MIRYSLKCDNAHSFESWFRSAEAFDALRVARHVACPDCGSTTVEKALMAPTVAPSRKAAPGAQPSESEARAAAIAELKRRVETNSEYVGMNFAAEARRIHDGDAPERSIYGEARRDEAIRLLEDGVPVAPLPFVPKSRTN